MRRLALILTAFLLLSAWAGAQGPAPLAADQVRLLRANRVLLGDLVTSGVELGSTDDPVNRAAACHGAAHALGVALRRAAEASDADRVAELGGHLDRVVRDGLVPILDEATKTIPPDSQDAVRLKAIRVNAAGDLDSIRTSIPADGAFSDSAKVRDLLGKLDALRERLK
jgi:hypothetical protein